MANPPAFFSPFVELLRNSVGRIPNTVPNASINDTICQCSHDVETPNGDYTLPAFHQDYPNCFHPNPKGQPEVGNVMRGEYGMESMISYLEELSTRSAVTPDDFKLVSKEIEELLDLIHQRIKQAPKLMQVNSGGPEAAYTRKKGGKQRQYRKPCTYSGCAI